MVVLVYGLLHKLYCQLLIDIFFYWEFFYQSRIFGEMVGDTEKL